MNASGDEGTQQDNATGGSVNRQIEKIDQVYP
jgi:hypothetical protein